MKQRLSKGEINRNIPLAQFTTWQIGGPAERLYIPQDLTDLPHFLKTLPEDEPITWLGIGSNVLISDEGIKGTVIITQGALNNLTQEGEVFRAEAGVSCAQVARFAARQNLGGKAEFLAGIPGSIGGALLMNAGCFGNETWNQVIKVETINRQGEINIRDRSEFISHYRHIEGLGEDEWFVAGYFQFESAPMAQSMLLIKEKLQKRHETQPANEPCCGSVFRNPPGHHSAKLIQDLGLKGYQIGGIQVSEKHANFMINRGGATAQDVKALMQHVQTEVKKAYGIELVAEVRVLGNGF